MTRIARRLTIAGGLLLSLCLGSMNLSADAASADFTSDFESGVLNDADTKTPSQGWARSGNMPTVTSEHARSGKYAMKTYLNKYTSATPYRTEIVSRWHTTSDTANRAPANMAYFTDHWVGFSVYLPSAYWKNASTTYGLMGQVHSTGTEFVQPMVSLHVSYTAKAPALYWYIPTTGKGAYHIAPIEPDLDKWVDWVFHFRWNYNAEGTGNNVAGHPESGMLEVWKDGVKVVSIPGPWRNDSQQTYGPTWKMGLYTGWVNSAAIANDTLVTERLVYHDEFRYAGAAGGYEAVAPRSNMPMPPERVLVE